MALEEKGPGAFHPEQIYLSIDKDILSEDHASCTWSQGDVSLEELTCMIRVLLRETGARGLYPAGIDICGESEADDTLGCRISEAANSVLLDLLRQELPDEK